MSTLGESPYNPQAAAAMGQLRVELDRLQETSSELQLEIDNLGDAAEQLRGNPVFGDSRVHGAGALAARHQAEILPDMQQLVRNINGGLRAGDRVLRQIAKRYDEMDGNSKRRLDKELERILEDDRRADGSIPPHGGQQPPPATAPETG